MIFLFLLGLFGLSIWMMYIFMDTILLWKIQLTKQIKEYFRQDFQCLDCSLLTEDKIIHDSYIKERLDFRERINRELMEELCRHFEIEEEKSVLLIRYRHDDKIYRLYIDFNRLKEGFTMIYPLKIDEWKKSIEENQSRDLYFFLKNECNQIRSATINNENIRPIIEECNGFIHDFGFTIGHPIKIEYIMNEVGVEILEECKIEYDNFHFNDEKMEIEEHVFCSQNQEDYFCSEIMKTMNEKNKSK